MQPFKTKKTIDIYSPKKKLKPSISLILKLAILGKAKFKGNKIILKARKK